MKICHMTSTHREKDQRIFEKECVSLAKRGYEVYLVEQGITEDAKGVHILGAGETKKGRYYRLLARPVNVWRIARRIDADLYHFHDMELLPYGNLLKMCGKKVIFDCHEDFASRFARSDAILAPGCVKKLLQILYQWYEYHSVRKYDAVISVTPHICRRLKRMNPETYMITNYPLSDAEEWNREEQKDSPENAIVYAGQIDDTYRLTFITEAIQEIPDIRFRICGHERKEGDIDAIKAVDRNHKAEFAGRRPFMEIPAFLKTGCMAIVLTSYCENSGWKAGNIGSNKLFEAMLCGLPVICTDYDYFKRIVEQNRCGLCINPYKKSELINAVTYLLEHPGEAREMGKRGKRLIERKYNWKTQEQVLFHIYERMAASVKEEEDLNCSHR